MSRYTVSVLSPEQQGIYLGPREYAVLNYLASHRGRYVPASELLDYVWSGIGDEAQVRVVISQLRQRFGASAIEGGRGFGYRLSHGRAEELDHVCGECRRLMVDHGDVRQCYGCGAQVEKPRPIGGVGEVGDSRTRQGGARGGAPWTEEEVAFVMEHLGDMTHQEIGEYLERSEASVRGLLKGRGVRKPYVRREKGVGGCSE